MQCHVKNIVHIVMLRTLYAMSCQEHCLYAVLCQEQCWYVPPCQEHCMQCHVKNCVGMHYHAKDIVCNVMSRMVSVWNGT